MVNADTVRSMFEYVPGTGELIRAGSPAGCKRKDGYVQISIKNKLYLRHRLVWLYCTGSWPSHQVDHVNGVRGDDRIENLRDVSNMVNSQNRRSGRGVTKALGVYPVAGSSTFRAIIKVNGKQVHLGTYDTVAQASEAYIEAKRELHEGCTI